MSSKLYRVHAGGLLGEPDIFIKYALKRRVKKEYLKSMKASRVHDLKTKDVCYQLLCYLMH